MPWLGKVNVTVAMAKGGIRSKGKVAAVMKLVRITKPLFAPYVKILWDADRPDLVNAAE